MLEGETMDNPLLENLHAMEELELHYELGGMEAIESVIPEYARPYWKPALQGDVEAVGLSFMPFGMRALQQMSFALSWVWL